MKKIINLLGIMCFCLLQSVYAQQVDSVEYFIDTDPGFGRGTGVPTTQSANIAEQFFTVSTASLTAGFHQFYIRSHSTNGHWSLTRHWLFYKDAAQATGINRMEYFIDNDPGFGNGTSIAFTPGATVSELFFTVDITSLSQGFHRFFIRSRDNDGNWSVTNRWIFFKDLIPATQVNRLEYFIDTDPGFGNGTAVTITPGGNISEVFFTVDITSISLGFHRFLVRSRDNNGNWSVTQRWIFFKDIIPATQVSRIEYFVDTDPGFGNATAASFTPGANLSDLALSLDISALSGGFHKIYMRSQDNRGNWSITGRWGFFKEFIPSPLRLRAAEYFFNTDPGIGNGTAVSLPGTLPDNLADYNFTADIGALANNTLHYFFVRVLDSNNNWSLTNVVSFTKSSTVPVSWLQFDAVARNGMGYLDWKTGTEINSSHFEVERSTNGYQFTKLFSLPAAGNSSSVQSYAYIDREPAKGNNYYRIRQVDRDGASGYSPVRKLYFEGEAPVLSISPNPASELVWVKTGRLPVQLGIFNAAGQRMMEMRITSPQTAVKLGHLAAGTYQAVLYEQGRVIAVETLVISR